MVASKVLLVLCLLIVQTLARLQTRKCVINGLLLNPGEKYQSVAPKCSGHCRCTPKATLFCVSQCPPAGISCQRDEQPIAVKPAIGKCECLTWECLKKEGTVNITTSTGKCIVGDKTYNPGDNFVSPGCSGYCTCYNGGSVVCSDKLCPAKQLQCNDNEVEVKTLEYFQNTTCRCFTKKCLHKNNPDKCKDGNSYYASGSRFVSADCTAWNRCGAKGSVSGVSLCPPHNIMCSPFETKVKIHRKIPNSNCTCPSWQCLKLKVKGHHHKSLIAIRPRPPMLNITSSLQSCSYDNVTYTSGETFTTSDCRGYCKCQHDGSIVCINTCMPRAVICPRGFQATESSRRIGKTNCSCPTWRCRPKYADKCSAFGKTYKFGERFISPTCQSCRCGFRGIYPKMRLLIPMHNPLSCVSLCPPRDILCPPGFERKNVAQPRFKGTNCSCSRPVCVKARRPKTKRALPITAGKKSCIVNGKSYKNGKYFYQNCSSRCRCIIDKHSVGYACVPLCPLYNIRCPSGQKKVQIMAPLSWRKKCSCPTWKCVKARRPKTKRASPIPARNKSCIVNGKSYKNGEYFYQDCSSRCRCIIDKRSVGYACVPLCPLYNIQCPSGQKKVQIMEPLSWRKNCSCPTWKCVKARPCIVNGKSYKNGEYFYQDCSSRCQCDKHSAGYTCVPLCPLYNIRCPSGEKKVQIMEPLSWRKNCSCPTWKCVKGTSVAPCRLQRLQSTTNNSIWPRCDTSGYFVPMQCDPPRNECWCVHKNGTEISGTRLVSQKPQCPI